jgi:hypothetical protein
MRWRSASLTACSCVVLAAGCGGHGSKQKPRVTGPRIPAAVAQRLARESDAVATSLDAGDRCAAAARAQALQRDTIARIGSVPAQLQETLQGTVNDLVDRVGPVCSERPPAAGGKAKGKGKGHEKKHGGEGGGD